MSVYIIECPQPLLVEKGQRPNDVFLEAYNKVLTGEEVWKTREVGDKPVEIALEGNPYKYEIKKIGEKYASITMLPLRRGARGLVAEHGGTQIKEVQRTKRKRLRADRRGEGRFYLMHQDNQQQAYIHGVVHCSLL